MSSSSNVFALIKSMNKQEKRYFKLFATSYTNERENTYTLLFDVLDKMADYDKEEVARKTAGSITRGNLAKARHKLNRLILNSLAAYHSASSCSAELRELLAHIEVLYTKGQYKHCRKLINNARRKACECEKFTVLLEIAEWERALLLQEMPDSLQDDIVAVNQSIRETVHTIDTIAGYRTDLDNVFASIHRDLGQSARASESSGPTRTNRKKSLSLKTADAVSLALMREQHRAYTAWHDRDLPEALDAFGKATALWDARPALAADQSAVFHRDLTNYLSCCIALKRFAEVPPLLNKIKAIPIRSPEQEVNMFKRISYLELGYSLNVGDLDRGRTAVRTIEKGLMRFGDRIDPFLRLSMHHNCSILYFICGQYSDALQHLIEIEHQPRHELRRDLQEFTRIFNLIVHFELNNHDIVANMFRSASRYLSKRATFGSFEKVSLRNIKKLLNCPDRQAAQKVFATFRSELLQISKATASFTEPLGYMEVLFWIEGKRLGESTSRIYSEAIRRRNNGEPALIS